ncbi:hypothetical protein HK100_004005 [Physocladia obscura]|uniref:C2H2-type domain-containing protein n=1 Tax=Physocladia obscura TaxID=109957 RepID=A0AAD5T7I3_9FUNG|nr:hypothetical protein HK100_004005 [Physocladia obscura]
MLTLTPASLFFEDLITDEPSETNIAADFNININPVDLAYIPELALLKAFTRLQDHDSADMDDKFPVVGKTSLPPPELQVELLNMNMNAGLFLPSGASADLASLIKTLMDPTFWPNPVRVDSAVSTTSCVSSPVLTSPSADLPNVRISFSTFASWLASDVVDEKPVSLRSVSSFTSDTPSLALSSIDDMSSFCQDQDSVDSPSLPINFLFDNEKLSVDWLKQASLFGFPPLDFSSESIGSISPMLTSTESEKDLATPFFASAPSYSPVTPCMFRKIRSKTTERLLSNHSISLSLPAEDDDNDSDATEVESPPRLRRKSKINSVATPKPLKSKSLPTFPASVYTPPSSASSRRSKIFSCPYNGCVKIFSHAISLKSHLFLHSEEKPPPKAKSSLGQSSVSDSEATEVEASPKLKRKATPLFAPQTPKAMGYGFSSRMLLPSSSASANGNYYPSPTGTTSQNQNQSTTMIAVTKRRGKALKVFKCPHAKCDKSFPRAYNLKSHMFCHSGERPHKCTSCHRAFARRHDLQRHMRTLHGAKNLGSAETTTGFIPAGAGSMEAMMIAIDGNESDGTVSSHFSGVEEDDLDS